MIRWGKFQGCKTVQHSMVDCVAQIFYNPVDFCSVVLPMAESGVFTFPTEIVDFFLLSVLPIFALL